MSSNQCGKLEDMEAPSGCEPAENTALRDIQGLIGLGLLTKDAGGGRSTSYSLNEA